MNKEEAQVKIEELEIKLEELKKVVNKPEIKKPFRAKHNEQYYLLDDDGHKRTSTEIGHKIDHGRWLVGNYFETEEQAEKSNIKKMLGKYDYYLAGISENFDEIPTDREIQYVSKKTNMWLVKRGKPNRNYNYRWLRHPKSDTA